MTIDRVDLAQRFVAGLGQSERLPLAQWSAYRDRLLEGICRHAATSTRYNRQRLAPLFECGDPKGGAFRYDRWEDVPILTRAGALAQGDDINATDVPDFAGESMPAKTSGSTGEPLRFRRSALAEAAAAAMFERMLAWFGVDRSSGLAMIHLGAGLDDGPREGRGWNLTDRSAPRYEMSKADEMRTALDWMLAKRPHALFAPPSWVEGLIHEGLASGRVPDSVRFVLVTSENSSDMLRDQVRDVLRATLIDGYGTREVGQIAIDCPDNPEAKHICAEIMHVEIVDHAGRSVAPGEAGRVVVTPFYNFATPLVRYDVGDIAVRGAGPCRCGRTLPTLGRVLGRQNTQFTFRDGTRRFPSGVEPLHSLLSARRLQVVQTGFEAIEIRYVPRDADAPRDHAAAIALLRDKIHPQVAVTFVAMDDIPRNAGGKYELFVSHITL